MYDPNLSVGQLLSVSRCLRNDDQTLGLNKLSDLLSNRRWSDRSRADDQTGQKWQSNRPGMKKWNFRECDQTLMRGCFEMCLHLVSWKMEFQGKFCLNDQRGCFTGLGKNLGAV